MAEDAQEGPMPGLRWHHLTFFATQLQQAFAQELPSPPTFLDVLRVMDAAAARSGTKNLICAPM